MWDGSPLGLWGGLESRLPPSYLGFGVSSPPGLQGPLRLGSSCLQVLRVYQSGRGNNIVCVKLVDSVMLIDWDFPIRYV